MVAASETTPPRESSGEMSRRISRSDIMLSLVLLASFSLALIDLAGYWLSNPWTRYSLVFIPLVAWVAYNEDNKQRQPRLGAVLIVAAMFVQLTSAKAAMLALSRPALACALIGFLLNRGFASKRCAVLSVFIVPIPYSLASDLGGLESSEWLFLKIASALGIGASLFDHVLTVGGKEFALTSTYAGLPLVVLSLGLAGYAGLRRHSGLSGALRGWGALMLAAPIVQACAIAFALFALSSGASQLALFLLDTLTWIAIALPTIVLTERAVIREGERAS
jgi:hypothetical protein